MTTTDLAPRPATLPAGAMDAQEGTSPVSGRTDGGPGWLRPAVFGVTDGLVSNAALIAGVAGGTSAGDPTTTVVLAGLAGLSAGAFSMAVGEYVSVASQAESQREVDRPGAGSPWVAAASSLGSFAVGALVPLLPFLLGASSVVPALLATVLALFGCGAVVTRVTDRPWWYGGVRQALLGAAAFAATYGVGGLVGAGV